jgi:hypothetical protein
MTTLLLLVWVMLINFDSPGKVVRLQGQLKNTSSESLKTEFANLSLQFC